MSADPYVEASVEYDLHLMTPDNAEVISLNTALAFEYTKVLNDVGRVLVTLPYNFDPALIVKDSRIVVWRKAPYGTSHVDFHGILTWWKWEDDDQGNTTLQIGGPSINGLLRRRIIAYPAGDILTYETARADQMMQDIVYWNFVAPRDSNRYMDITITGYGGTVHGPMMTKAYAWENVLDVLKAINQASAKQGNEIFFELSAPDTGAGFTFTTSYLQPGTDHRQGATVPLILSAELGSIRTPSLTVDYDAEENFVYAGGKGEGIDRRILTAEDETREYVNAISRSEGFADARTEYDSDDSVQAAADSAVGAGRPVIRFEGSIVNMEDSRYGVDWVVGDRVTASYRDQTFLDCLIRSVHVAVDNMGRETIDAKIEWNQARRLESES